MGLARGRRLRQLNRAWQAPTRFFFDNAGAFDPASTPLPNFTHGAQGGPRSVLLPRQFLRHCPEQGTLLQGTAGRIDRQWTAKNQHSSTNQAKTAFLLRFQDGNGGIVRKLDHFRDARPRIPILHKHGFSLVSRRSFAAGLR